MVPQGRSDSIGFIRHRDMWRIQLRLAGVAAARAMRKIMVGHSLRPHWMGFSGLEVRTWNCCKQGLPESPIVWYILLVYVLALACRRTDWPLICQIWSIPSADLCQGTTWTVQVGQPTLLSPTTCFSWLRIGRRCAADTTTCSVVVSNGAPIRDDQICFCSNFLGEPVRLGGRTVAPQTSMPFLACRQHRAG